MSGVTPRLRPRLAEGRRPLERASPGTRASIPKVEPSRACETTKMVEPRASWFTEILCSSEIRMGFTLGVQGTVTMTSFALRQDEVRYRLDAKWWKSGRGPNSRASASYRNDQDFASSSVTAASSSPRLNGFESARAAPSETAPAASMPYPDSKRPEIAMIGISA
jgi:hypothetical protein